MPEDKTALNSFFTRRENRDTQMAALKTWMTERSFDTPVILVTHQVVVSALTGKWSDSGEIQIARVQDDGSVAYVGSILE